MTTVRQCLKNVVFPGYLSARNKLTSKTKTKGPGGSAVKKKSRACYQRSHKENRITKRRTKGNRDAHTCLCLSNTLLFDYFSFDHGIDTFIKMYFSE